LTTFQADHSDTYKTELPLLEPGLQTSARFEPGPGLTNGQLF